jgi:hypothetical protein
MRPIEVISAPQPFRSAYLGKAPKSGSFFNFGGPLRNCAVCGTAVQRQVNCPMRNKAVLHHCKWGKTVFDESGVYFKLRLRKREMSMIHETVRAALCAVKEAKEAVSWYASNLSRCQIGSLIANSSWRLSGD